MPGAIFLFTYFYTNLTHYKIQSDTNYIKVASHEAEIGTFDTVLLLYSGGLDTSVMLKWIKDHCKADIITLTIDIGQKQDDLEFVKNKALELGAKKAIVLDAKDMFAEKFISKAIKANVDYQGGYHLFCPLGRAIISELAVKVAHEEGISVIAHGCTGKGNDQVRFEGYITTLDPNLKTIAPVREWSMSREEQLAYAQKHGIPVIQSSSKIYSYDENLWGNSAEGGEIEDLSLAPNFENILITCQLAENAPDQAEQIELEFKEGLPIALNSQEMSLTQIIQALAKIGAKHAIGITPLIEDRIVGLKVRGIYEEPAAEIIIKAHKDLEKLVCTREENEFKSSVDQKWAYLCYGAKWFHPLMSHLNAYADNVNKKVTGKVTVNLFKGKAMVLAAESPYSLHDQKLATFMKSSGFNQNASPGFIELWNLPQKTAYQLSQEKVEENAVPYQVFKCENKVAQEKKASFCPLVPH